MLFFTKNKSVFQNLINQEANKEQGLAYSNEILGDLVNRDTDLDGVLDWEESLWGTDPTKRDTNDDGVGDNIEIAKIKSVTGQNQQGESLLGENQTTEQLTETDKFSREFFSTVATLNQTGAMDQVTVDKLSSSLAEHIQNTAPRKVFLLSELKVIDDNAQAFKKYADTLGKVLTKYPLNQTVPDVLQKFIIDEESVNVKVLSEFDPIIKQTNNTIKALAVMSIPRSFLSVHLDFMNALQKLTENVHDIKLYETDVIISLSAISQYDQNTTKLQGTISNLTNAIDQKLSN